MTISLELYRQKKEKDFPHPLVLRFAVNRKTYRYPCNKNLTDAAWMFEQKNGYPNTGDALDLEKKANHLLQDISPNLWRYEDFAKDMELPIIPKDAITKLWSRYDLHRDNLYEKAKLAWRTRELDTTVKHKVEAFLRKHPKLNNVHLWKATQLEMFETFLMDELKHPQSTAKIYLETFRTFFSWCVDPGDDEEGNEIEGIISRNPFARFKIRKGEDSWFPYSYKEVNFLLSLEPETDKERFAQRWVKLLLYSGGADPIEFSTMKWKQVQTEAIQLTRVKVRKSSKAGKKLLYLTDEFSELLPEIRTTRGKPDDYVQDVYKPDLTERQNIDRHKRFMDKIKEGMRSMLTHYYKKLEAEGKPVVNIEFVIKRLRPTAAVIANAATKDVNYVSKMLMHSNLEQTTVYLSGMPNDEMRLMQIKYEDALKAVLK